MDNNKLTLEEFGQKVKMQYPQYNGLSDREIGEKTLQKYPDYANRIKPDEGFVADLKGIATGIKESAIKRSDTFGEIDQAQKAGEQGMARTLLQKFGQGAGFASDVIGETFMGVLKALTPQKAQETVGDVVKTGVEAVAETKPVQDVVNWYQNLDDVKKRDVDATLGTLGLTLDVATGGILKKPVQEGVETVVKKAGDVVEGAVDIAKNPIRATAKLKTVADDITPQPVKDVINVAKEKITPTPTLEQATGQVLQGKTQDITKSIDALQAIDTTDVKTYADLEKSINKNVKALASKVDDDLAVDATKLPLKALETKTTTKGGKEISTNFVDTALKHLDELYEKTGDLTESANIKELIEIANRDGLTRLEVNDISRVYGREFGSKAFSKLGDPLTSVNAQMYENVRTGLKDVARAGINGAEAKQADEFISRLLNAQDLVKRNVEAVNKLQQKIKERGLLEKLGHGLTKYADILTGGSIRGLIGGLLPRGAGYKVLNALDLEEQLMKNLDIIRRAEKSKSATEFRKIIDELNIGKEDFSKTTVPKKVSMESFEKAPDLTPENRIIETKAFQKIIDNEPALLEEYKRIEGTKGGKVINTDEFRKLFKDEGYAGHNAVAVQEPSSYLAKKAFTNILKNPEENVAFLAGGSGTGKSSAVKGVPEIAEAMSQSAGVLDSNLSNYGSAMKKIKEVLDAGKTPVITFVYRDPMDAFENGVVKRMLENVEEGGRLVPSSVVAGNHIDSWNVIQRLYKEGVEVNFIDNSLGFKKAKLVSFDELKKKIKYPSKEELTELFNAKARELYGSGRIKTLDQLNGYLNE